ncbi:MAG TPA: phosphotransferase, partial [Longimicrobiales bacterium]|nr:phosphotransferase [Longimicrobiales bacterium]
MNGEWLDLLREVGITEPPDWRDVIVVQNYVRGIARRPDHPWASRFNFVLLEGGSPRHFGKCRPLWDTAVERETAIRACLATCDSGKLRIPAARVAASERIRIQLGPFVAGSQYSRVTLRQSADEFLASVRTALSGAGELADLALASGLCETSPGDSIELCARAEQPLAFLAGRASFPDRLIDALRRAMADAGALPARPQHGDLWHRNLIVADDQL